MFFVQHRQPTTPFDKFTSVRLFATSHTLPPTLHHHTLLCADDFVAHAGNVNCISIGRRTGKIIATGGDDQSVNIWGVGKPNCLHKLTGHTSAIEAVTFDNNEATVVGGSASGTLKL